jgi:hypothetical protein
VCDNHLNAAALDAVFTHTQILTRAYLVPVLRGLLCQAPEAVGCAGRRIVGLVTAAVVPPRSSTHAHAELVPVLRGLQGQAPEAVGCAGRRVAGLVAAAALQNISSHLPYYNNVKSNSLTYRTYGQVVNRKNGTTVLIRLRPNSATTRVHTI